MANNDTILSAIGDNNKPIDWWFIYKVAGKSEVSDGSKAQGTEYVYYDSDKQDTALRLSKFHISDPANGAVSNTLNQIYNNANNPDMGWFFYNDEDPITLKTNGERGHTKGVICFNTANNTAFWLIHSAPKFPSKDTYSYPETAMGNAQTFLCITLQDADTAKAIAAQMFVAQQPNVYLASQVPDSLKSMADDPRVQLIGNKITTDKASYGNFISFNSAGGATFRCVAKNKEWNTPEGNDFYNDLVGPMLKESLDIETWEHGKEPGNLEGDDVHHIMAMKEVNLGPLSILPSYLWSEENDHAKLVISQPEETDHFVCVGDINFTVTMEKRSGGTVAFQNDNLWTGINEILSAIYVREARPGAKPKATEKKSASQVPIPQV
jgi:deoxyribonuclease II